MSNLKRVALGKRISDWLLSEFVIEVVSLILPSGWMFINERSWGLWSVLIEDSKLVVSTLNASLIKKTPSVGKRTSCLAQQGELTDSLIVCSCSGGAQEARGTGETGSCPLNVSTKWDLFCVNYECSWLSPAHITGSLSPFSNLYFPGHQICDAEAWETVESGQSKTTRFSFLKSGGVKVMYSELRHLASRVAEGFKTVRD